MQVVNCNWIIEDSNRKALKTTAPIYIDNIDEDYFAGSRFVKNFFDEIWKLLNNLNAKGIL